MTLQDRADALRSAVEFPSDALAEARRRSETARRRSEVAAAQTRKRARARKLERERERLLRLGADPAWVERVLGGDSR